MSKKEQKRGLDRYEEEYRRFYENFFILDLGKLQELEEKERKRLEKNEQVDDNELERRDQEAGKIRATDF